MLKERSWLFDNSIVKDIKKITFYGACLTCLSSARTFLYSVITTIINIPFYAAAENINDERRLEVYGSDRSVTSNWHHSLASSEIKNRSVHHLKNEKQIKIDENITIVLQEQFCTGNSSSISKAEKIQNNSSSWLIAKKETGFNQKRREKIYHEAWVLDKMGMLEYFVIAPDNAFLIIQPFIEGYDLDNLPHETPLRFNFFTLLGMAIELFTQLEKLHQLGLIHSDLVDKNVMLQLDKKNSPHLFLIDFGASYLKSATSLGWYFQLRDTVNAWDIVYNLFKEHVLTQEKNKRLYLDSMKYISLNKFHCFSLFCIRTKKAIRLLHTIKEIEEKNLYEIPNSLPSRILKEKFTYWFSPTELFSFLKSNIGFFSKEKNIYPSLSGKTYSTNVSFVK